MGNLLVSLILYLVLNSMVSDALHNCCNMNRIDDSTYVKCVHCGLQTIPLDIPKNTASLDLSYNNVTMLLKGSFIHLPLIEYLTIKWNKLSVLSSGTFEPLINLKYLDLSFNQMDMSSFTTSVFRPLSNLQVLKINNNNIILRKGIPDSVFWTLPYIETLTVDLFDGFSFGAGFLSLRNLNTVEFYQNGNLLSIRNTSFQGIERMNISLLRLYIQTKDIETNALYPFQNVSSLYINTHKKRDMHFVLPLLYGLRETTIDNIRFSLNYVPNAGGVHLGKADLQFLSTICVRHLILSDNAIQSISIKAILSWKRRDCIKRLDLSQNYLTSPQVIIILNIFPSLRYFDYTYRKFVLPKKRRGLFDRRMNLPNSLYYLNITNTHFFSHYGTYNFKEDNNLKIFDVSYQKPQLYCGDRIKGLVNLVEFDISGTKCSIPHPEMFTEMEMLSKLNARDCELGKSSLFHTNTLFKGLKYLSYVDLSSNQIAQLNSSTFTDQTKSLKSLILADNIMDGLPIQTLEELNVLEVFDISNNRFISLTKFEYTLLDNYRSKSDKFTVKLAGNPLSCDCDNLDFISWIGTTRVVYDKDQLVCAKNNMKIVKFLESFRDFSIHCVSQFWLIVSFTLTIICLVLGIVLRLAWRYSVRIRLWCRQPEEHDNYTYDIFVSYCREDSKWIRKTLAAWLEEHSIKYSAEDKTFDIRLDVCDNIFGAIDHSYQSLFVVSCKFLEYEWQTFAMKVASRYSFREGRENMNIIILLDDMKRSEFPKLIRENWDKIRPLHWPDKHNTDKTRLSTARKLFWEKLLKRIRKGNKRLAACSLSESTL